MSSAVATEPSARDFDFWMGSWTSHHRRRRKWLAGCDEWDEFDASIVARPILDGHGNEEEFRTDFAGGFVGMAFRFFDPVQKQWVIYWADSRRSGELDPPVYGNFSGDTGLFEGHDTFEGRAILVRYTWSRVTTPSPHWEQSFSEDGGVTWETNWITDFTRVGDS
jgi:hypothetical protein